MRSVLLILSINFQSTWNQAVYSIPCRDPRVQQADELYLIVSNHSFHTVRSRLAYVRPFCFRPSFSNSSLTTRYFQTRFLKQFMIAWLQFPWIYLSWKPLFVIAVSTGMFSAREIEKKVSPLIVVDRVAFLEATHFSEAVDYKSIGATSSNEVIFLPRACFLLFWHAVPTISPGLLWCLIHFCLKRGL